MLQVLNYRFVEVRGVEPRSEKVDLLASTCVGTD